MDREDARFVARALKCRISGDRTELERLAASSLLPLSAIAAAIDRRNTGENYWPAAETAADQLMRICRYGGNLVDQLLDQDSIEQLEQFCASMDKLADEPPVPVNRQQRRELAAIDGRRNCLAMVGSKRLIGFNS